MVVVLMMVVSYSIERIQSAEHHGIGPEGLLGEHEKHRK